MKPDDVVAAILQTAGRCVAAWWPHFQPRPNLDPGLSARDLSFQFATAFLRHFPKGIVLMDLAFAKAMGQGAANQLDTYLFTNECAFLLECRQDLYEKCNIRDIADAMTQMTTGLAARIGQRHRRAAKPPLIVGVVLAVAWGDKGAPPPWPVEGLPADWHYGTIKIVADEFAPARNGPQRVLYWLYAVSPPVRLAPRSPAEEDFALDEGDQGLTATSPAAVPDEAVNSGWVYEGGEQAEALEAAGARFAEGNPAQGRFLLVFSPRTQRLVGAFRVTKKVPAELVTRGWIYRGTAIAKLLVSAGVDYLNGNPLPQEIFVFDKAQGTVILGHYRSPAAAP